MNPEEFTELHQFTSYYGRLIYEQVPKCVQIAIFNDSLYLNDIFFNVVMHVSEESFIFPQIVLPECAVTQFAVTNQSPDQTRCDFYLEFESLPSLLLDTMSKRLMMWALKGNVQTHFYHYVTIDPAVEYCKG